MFCLINIVQHITQQMDNALHAFMDTFCRRADASFKVKFILLIVKEEIKIGVSSALIDTT